MDPMQIVTEPPPPPPEVVLAPPAQVQQSPFTIRTLSPGNRLNVYAILQGLSTRNFIRRRLTWINRQNPTNNYNTHRID